MTVHLKRNDTKDTISYTVTNPDGSVVNLTGATVKFVMGKNKTLITNAAATIVSATAGQVSYTLTEADTLAAGTFNAEFEVTFGNGKVKSYPTNGYILVNIQANIDKDKSTYIEDNIAYRVSDIQVLKNSIQAQLDQFVKGDSAPEVAQARVEADGTTNATLKARLDKKEAEFKAFRDTTTTNMAQSMTQLSEKVDKNGAGQITWAMAAQDFREQITGGNTAVVGVNSVLNANIVDKAVSLNKMDDDFQYILFPKKSIKNPIQNLDQTATTHINTSVRFIQKEIVYKNTFLNKINVYLGSDGAQVGGNLKLELFSVNGSTLTKYYEKTVVGKVGLNTIDVNLYIKENTYICFSRTGLALLKYKSGAQNNCYYTSNLTDTSLTISTLSFGNFVLSMSVEVIDLGIRPFKLETTNTLLVDKENGDFTNIQDAINSITDDSAVKPYTIYVGQGVFPRFSMRSSVTGISRMRYISIIGANKYTTIIKDDTGHYVTGSCDVWTKGVIENLTIEVTHDNDISEPNRKSYAVHLDFGQCDVEFRNCILISRQAPAAGIGLYQDTTIKFKDCELYNLCPSDYPVLLDYGAIFCHSQDATNITNQKIILKNCKVISQNGNKGAWFSKIGTGGEMVVESINTMYFSHNVNGIRVENNAVLSPYSYGNNASNLNAS